ncbi:MAG: hypothetical protein HFH42_04700 [Lachnospiraceae bacterium]|jgi:hypothetical protein|nr:hypothetical protein [Lachnospiraceae bacterium]
MTKKHKDELIQCGNTLPSAHITKDQFCNWQEGKLEGAKEEGFFAHIGACTFCAEQFGNWMEEGVLDEPPSYLKEEVMDRAHRLDIQASIKWKETSRQVQLALYSLKVGLAVVASIFLLTVTANVQDLDLGPSGSQQVEQSQDREESKKREEGVVGKLRRHSTEVTGLLNDLSRGIFRIGMDGSENERNQEVTR